MKNIKHLLLIFALVALSFANTNVAFSQEEKHTITTIIIVRHAEKDAGDDPGLTVLGMDRAQKLSALFPGVKPDEMYTTPYLRTRQTLEPWAKEAGVEVKEYKPQTLPDFADYLKGLEGKNVVVAGHSNTNPQLVNLLINEEKYTNLDDSDYATIYVVTIKKGFGKVKVIKN